MSRTPPNRFVAPRPAAGRARSRHATGYGSRLLRFLVGLAIAGCAPVAPTTSVAPSTSAASTPAESPTAGASAAPPAPTGTATGPDLLLLAFDGDAATLCLVRLSGEVVPLPLPDPGVAAVVPVAGGRLVALLRDGDAFVAPGGPAGLLAGTGWRTLPITNSGALPVGAIVWSAASSPDGMQVAAIARPRDAESPSALVVIEPVRGRRDIRPLADGAEGVPPAWIGPGRVVIMERDRLDRSFLALIATATGRVADRLPIRALAFGTSGDARSAVVVETDGIVVGPTASVLATRRAPEAGPAMPAGDVVRGGVALSADGGFLAAAIEEGDSGPSRIAVYEKTGGAWRGVIRVQPPVSASGGWLAWLP